jgi:hypothetical protein
MERDVRDRLLAHRYLHGLACEELARASRPILVATATVDKTAGRNTVFPCWTSVIFRMTSFSRSRSACVTWADFRRRPRITLRTLPLTLSRSRYRDKMPACSC